jgi:branched-chain amino acid transport system ATP-binding protein
VRPALLAALGVVAGDPDSAFWGWNRVWLSAAFRVIGQVRDSGIATLIVDRDYRRVLARSDCVPVLHKGQVALAGDARSLRGSPQLGALLGV